MLTMILIFVCILLFSGSITTKINNDSLTVGYQLIFTKTTEIDYKDIKKLSYETELDIGRRNFGIGSPKLMSGTFENDAFGEYELYSYTGCNSYIVIETKHGYVVINDKNDETTKQLYKRLQSEIKGSN